MLGEKITTAWLARTLVRVLTRRAVVLPAGSQQPVMLVRASERRASAVHTWLQPGSRAGQDLECEAVGSSRHPEAGGRVNKGMLLV